MNNRYRVLTDATPVPPKAVRPAANEPDLLGKPQQPVDLSGLPHRLAWDLLCVYEPGLQHLAMSIRGWRRSWRNYERVKQRIIHLAGWEARNPRLRTSDAYCVAIDHVAKKVAP